MIFLLNLNDIYTILNTIEWYTRKPRIFGFAIEEKELLFESENRQIFIYFNASIFFK